MKKVSFLLFGAMLLVLAGCKKEGCTNPDAVNYSEDAGKDDGTCTFEGSAVFWYGQNTSTQLSNDGAITLTYYVNDNVVGSSATSVFWTASPTCRQNGSVTVTVDLGNATNKSYTYRVQDQDGWVYWEGVQNFTANTCEAVELVW